MNPAVVGIGLAAVYFGITMLDKSKTQLQKWLSVAPLFLVAAYVLTNVGTK